MKGLTTIAALGIVAILVLIGFDLTSTPKPAKGQCVLTRRTILPDICVNSCAQAFDCTKSTRPYGFFFTQAASCDDAVICP
jgi:hypothetical protein